MFSDKIIYVLNISWEEFSRYYYFFVCQYLAHDNLICRSESSCHFTDIQYDIMSKNVIGAHEWFVYYGHISFHDKRSRFVIETIIIQDLLEKFRRHRKQKRRRIIAAKLSFCIWRKIHMIEEMVRIVVIIKKRSTVIELFQIIMLESVKKFSVRKCEEAWCFLIRYMYKISYSKAFFQDTKHEGMSACLCHIICMIIFRETELQKIVHVDDGGS